MRQLALLLLLPITLWKSIKSAEAAEIAEQEGAQTAQTAAQERAKQLQEDDELRAQIKARLDARLQAALEARKNAQQAPPNPNLFMPPPVKLPTPSSETAQKTEKVAPDQEAAQKAIEEYNKRSWLTTIIKPKPKIASATTFTAAIARIKEAKKAIVTGLVDEEGAVRSVNPATQTKITSLRATFDKTSADIDTLFADSSLSDAKKQNKILSLMKKLHKTADKIDDLIKKSPLDTQKVKERDMAKKQEQNIAEAQKQRTEILRNLGDALAKKGIPLSSLVAGPVVKSPAFAKAIASGTASDISQALTEMKATAQQIIESDVGVATWKNKSLKPDPQQQKTETRQFEQTLQNLQAKLKDQKIESASANAQVVNNLKAIQKNLERARVVFEYGDPTYRSSVCSTLEVLDTLLTHLSEKPKATDSDMEQSISILRQSGIW